jgi:hypothetical protein
MAMHQPSAGVVRFKGKHEIALCRKRSSVSADRVVSFQTRNVARPSGASLLVEHVEVVAVEMYGMWKRWSSGILLNDPVLPLCVCLSVFMYVVTSRAGFGYDEPGSSHRL